MSKKLYFLLIVLLVVGGISSPSFHIGAVGSNPPVGSLDSVGTDGTITGWAWIPTTLLSP